MTKEDLKKAAEDWWTHQYLGYNTAFDFALEMVRRHNDECVVIAAKHAAHTRPFDTSCAALIYKEIREAKP